MLSSDHNFDQLSQVADALASPIRLKILENIAAAQKQGVEINMLQSITPYTDIPRSSISLHIQKLVDAGLVIRSKRGKHVLLSLRQPGFDFFTEFLKELQ